MEEEEDGAGGANGHLLTNSKTNKQALYAANYDLFFLFLLLL